MKPPATTSHVVIAIKDLVKTYGADTPNPVRALRGVSFSIEAGEFVAIMGTSGSGKSTMMNILGCLDRPSSGTYHLDGADVSQESRRRLAHLRSRALGFVFQNFQLLPRLTALENVELPLQYRGDVSSRQRRQNASDCLMRVGLSDKLHRRPTELSGGQQQRVAIARALVNSPRVLLADEPTGNLDTRTGLEVLALLQRLNSEGLTIVLVTHENDVAACARRKLLLRDGKLVADTQQLANDAQRELLALPVEEVSA
ncbi:MAG TPA: ABC transporter ATP-binding protein [Planctomycetota bacterium]|nr:ABC transporter ATP-binding protein [Planctomycetota bacterium]